MSRIVEQIKHLKELSNTAKINVYAFEELSQSLGEAAYTIEALSEKIQQLKEELRRRRLEHINENIKNPFAWTSTDLCQNCDHKDDYIEELEAELGENGWIPCKKKNPEEKINPITKDFYEYQVSFKCGDVTDIRHYKFDRGHWWNFSEIMDEYVVAWRPNIEPYQDASNES